MLVFIIAGVKSLRQLPLKATPQSNMAKRLLLQAQAHVLPLPACNDLASLFLPAQFDEFKVSSAAGIDCIQ